VEPAAGKGEPAAGKGRPADQEWSQTVTIWGWGGDHKLGGETFLCFFRSVSLRLSKGTEVTSIPPGHFYSSVLFECSSDIYHKF